MVLSDEQLDILIDTVEARLSQMLVSGCANRDELAALRRCRLELRVAKSDHPRDHAGRLRLHALPRTGASTPLVA